MEKKLEEVQELEESCFRELITLLTVFVEMAKERSKSIGVLESKISGYLECMTTLKMISFDEMIDLENLLLDYQMLKIEEG